MEILQSHTKPSIWSTHYTLLTHSWNLSKILNQFGHWHLISTTKPQSSLWCLGFYVCHGERPIILLWELSSFETRGGSIRHSIAHTCTSDTQWGLHKVLLPWHIITHHLESWSVVRLQSHQLFTVDSVSAAKFIEISSIIAKKASDQQRHIYKIGIVQTNFEENAFTFVVKPEYIRDSVALNGYKYMYI